MNEKIIRVPIGNQKAMALKFDVSEVTIWSALTFKTNSDLAVRIRKFALQDVVGGKVYTVENSINQ